VCVFFSVGDNRLNARELGSYVASRIVTQYLDPRSPVVDFSRPPGSGRDSGPVTRPASMGLALPTFTFPRAYHVDIPGGLSMFHSSLPLFDQAETSAMTTIKEGRVSVLKVGMRLRHHLISRMV
jgi:hypothetical protein